MRMSPHRPCSCLSLLLCLSGIIRSGAFAPSKNARLAPLHQSTAVLVRVGVPRFRWSLSAADADADESNDVADSAASESSEANVASPPPPVSNPVTPRRRMDPLIASLTRSDPPRDGGNKMNNPTVNVPLGGEIQLDQSLFVLLPVVLFAVLGGLLSVYVGLNSGDAVSQAWDAYETAINSPAGTNVVDPDACRGLCSSQEADLQALESFMNGLKK